MKFILALVLFLISFDTILATGTLIIKDKSTGEPISNVTAHFKILEKKGKDSTIVRISNRNGEMILPDHQNLIVMLQYIGYQRLIDTIKNDGKVITIKMIQTGIKTDDVVITGQIGPVSSQKAIYDVKSIGESRIQEQAATNLRDLLKTEPGIKITESGINGSQVSINGIGGSHIKVLINGVPVIGRMDGNIDMSQINLSNVKKVEIIEGPMSAMYGSNASGGVINLITHEPECERLEFTGKSLWESNGTFNFDGTMNYSIDKLNLSLTGGRNFFKGFDPFGNVRNLTWDPKIQYFTDLQVVYNFEDHKIRLWNSYFDEYILNRGNPRTPYFENAFDDHYYTKRFNTTLFFNGKIGNETFYDITSSYSYYQRKKNTLFKNLITLEETFPTDPEIQDTTLYHNVIVRANLNDDKLTDYLKYQIGTEFNYDITTGRKILDQSQDITDWGTYLNFQITSFDNFTLQPNIRLIYNSKYKAPPVGAMSFRYEMLKDLVLRGSYSSGFRAPSVKELYMSWKDKDHDITGNPDLKAEHSENINAAIQYSINDDKHYIKIESKYFYNKLKNAIQLLFAGVEGVSDNHYSYMNFETYKTTGMSSNIQYIRKDISLNASYTLTGVTTGSISDSIPMKYYFTPEFGLNIDYTLAFIDTKISLIYKHTGKQPIPVSVNNQILTLYRDSYNLMDLSFSKTFDNLSFLFGFKNLFNIKNITSPNTGSSSGGSHTDGESSSPIAMGTSFFIQFNIKI